MVWGSGQQLLCLLWSWCRGKCCKCMHYVLWGRLIMKASSFVSQGQQVLNGIVCGCAPGRAAHNTTGMSHADIARASQAPPLLCVLQRCWLRIKWEFIIPVLCVYALCRL